MTTTQKTGRTRWSTKHTEALRPMVCPACRSRQAVQKARRNEDALSWGALYEWGLACGHVVNDRGDLIGA